MAIKRFVTLLTVALLAITTSSDGVDDPFCDGTARCSEDYLPSAGPYDSTQRLTVALTTFLKNTEKVNGCFILFTTSKTSGEPVPVYYYFSCSNDSKEVCMDCFSRAAVGLRDGCSGRAGGIYSVDECCVRYEMYKIAASTLVCAAPTG
ncbi:hypothetical protein LINGRAHAP2_LOCUS8825 [Linum grandiflorum]